MDTAEHIIKDEPTQASLAKAAVILAGLVESDTLLSGPEKLLKVQSGLRELLKSSPLPEGTKADLLEAVDTVVPIVLQGAVFAAKVGIALQKNKGKLWCWR